MCRVAFGLTPVSDTSMDVAMVLRDVLMPLPSPMRPDWDEETVRRCGSFYGALVGQTVWPPSTTSAVPVVKAVTSQHSHSTAEPISSGLPSRPTGSSAMSASHPPGRMSPKRRIISVSMMPGQTALMRMPSAAWSRAAERVEPMTPCLAAA